MAPSSTRTQVIKWKKVHEQRKQKQRSTLMARPCDSDEYATSSSSSSSTTQEPAGNYTKKNNEEGMSSSDGCCTPKAKRFRIPEVLSCPPPPKKRRVTSKPNCSSPIPFFASPDIELFFFSALKSNISA